MKHKLDIFDTLRAIDQHDTEFLSNLPEEQSKGFAPPVVMRWASSTNSNTEHYLRSVNERANMHHYDLYQHPDLQYRLMASCGLGKHERHNWIGTTSDKKKARTRFVLQYWPNANELECDIILQELSDPSKLDNFLNTTGMQNEDIKRIKKLF
jgi:hypothetical protein